MLIQINLFFIVLSVLFITVKAVDFLINLFQEEPKVITYSVYEKIMLYLSLSHIITNIII